MEKVLISGEEKLLYDLEYRVYLIEFIGMEVEDVIDTDLLTYDEFVKERGKLNGRR